MQIAGVPVSKKLLTSIGGALALPFMGMPADWIWPSTLLACVGVAGVAVVDVALVMKGVKK